jgi:hypothetical protein
MCAKTNTLSEDVVVALGSLVGYPPLDTDTAARIAAGATNAMLAVAATATVSTFDTEPGEFAAELEALADAG